MSKTNCAKGISVCDARFHLLRPRSHDPFIEILLERVAFFDYDDVSKVLKWRY